MVAMPSPVALLSGETKSPSDCRAPIVTMRIAAAASVTTHPLRALSTVMACLRYRESVHRVFHARALVYAINSTSPQEPVKLYPVWRSASNFTESVRSELAEACPEERRRGGL